MSNPPVAATTVATADAPTGRIAQAMSRIEAGDVRTLSRAATLIENGTADGVALLEHIYARAPAPWVIGFTGVGGAGKSTLVPRVASHFARLGGKVAILAVDPSSPLSGGAVLGDRIRAGDQVHERIFCRSIASRGALGGLATCVSDVIRLMSVGGYSVVLVETVGTGQAEVAIRDTAHSVVLVTAPGLGDEIQAMKAGVMEVVSLLVVNKSDREGAEDALQTLQQAVGIGPQIGHHRRLHEGFNKAAGEFGDLWLPPVLKTMATTGEGLPELVTRLQEHRDFLDASGDFARRNETRDRVRLQEHLRTLLLDSALSAARADGTLDGVWLALSSGRTDPIGAARELAARVRWADALG